MTTPDHTPRERPIIFSGPMVRAILDGRKTVTRRIVTTRHPISFIGSRGEESDPACWGYAFDGPRQHGYMVLARGLDERFSHGRVSIPCPYGVPGNRLWVRETWAHMTGNGRRTVYRADGDPPMTSGGSEAVVGMRWRPSIFMRPSDSRILLEVTTVSVERLHDITEEDAQREGVRPRDAHVVVEAGSGIRRDLGNTHLGAFMCLWDEINGDRAPWADNPWVWRVAFRRIS